MKYSSLFSIKSNDDITRQRSTHISYRGRRLLHNSSILLLRKDSTYGFTILEMLVALTISSIILTIVVSGALTFRESYYADVTRTRINGNLRSAMDIVSMNIRQAGENLLSSFPAVLLDAGTASAADTLTLRRSLIPEVLTLCADANSGATVISVSSTTLTNSDCVAANVAPLFSVFEGLRTSEGGKLRVYIYDKGQKLGEFVDYSNGALTSGLYKLTLSALSRKYFKLTTSIYVIEEYKFSLDSTNKRFVLNIDGHTEEPRPVAFDVVDFQASLDMDDDTTLSSLSPSSTKDWKDIKEIQISLTGQSTTIRGRTMKSTVSAKFFPRNVLSYEG